MFDYSITEEEAVTRQTVLATVKQNASSFINKGELSKGELSNNNGSSTRLSTVDASGN